MLRKFNNTVRPYKTMVKRLAATDAASSQTNSKKAILQLMRFDP